MNTASGDAAAEVLGWVNEDPAHRAAEGITKLEALAHQAPTTAAWREVADIVRVVARLAPEGGS